MIPGENDKSLTHFKWENYRIKFILILTSQWDTDVDRHRCPNTAGGYTSEWIDLEDILKVKLVRICWCLLKF